MKFTLSECMQRINQALNYPSIDYTDVSHYFDTAIMELNTTLHISLPSVSEMIKIFKQKVSKNITKVRITSDPKANADIPVDDTTAKYYWDSENNVYHIGTKTYKELHGVFVRNGIVEEYESLRYGNDPFWVQASYMDPEATDLATYLPEEWIILWLIPYVCFKYACRDGGNGNVFAQELQEGFQQLQESFDIPETVNLASVAGNEAYTDLVEANLTDLNKLVRTRAITDNMKHDRAVNATYGSMYNRGGW